MILPSLKPMSPLSFLKKAAPDHSPVFILDAYSNGRFHRRVSCFRFGLFIFVWMMLFYLLISDSLMNKLDNGSRQINQVHVCPWLSSVSHLINKLMTDRKSTSTFSFKWWNLVSFSSLSYLKTLILMREKMVPRL